MHFKEGGTISLGNLIFDDSEVTFLNELDFVRYQITGLH